MGKRIFCLICAAVLVVASLAQCRVFAQAVEPGIPQSSKALIKPRSSHRSNPLVSAMFLVLAGVGFTLLFDKKK